MLKSSRKKKVLDAGGPLHRDVMIHQFQGPELSILFSGDDGRFFVNVPSWDIGRLREVIRTPAQRFRAAQTVRT
jgi:hypothetical protein